MKLSQYLIGGALLATSVSAQAEIYVITISGDATGRFEIDSSPTPNFVIDGIAFFVDNVPGSFNGVNNIAANFTFYSATGDFGGFAADTSAFLNLVGPQLYTGSEAAPTFRTGSFALTDFGGGPGAFTVSIQPLAAVPEPATWAMMIMGFGLIGGIARSARKRDVRVKFAMQ